MGRAKLVTAGKSLRGTYVSREQTGKSTGLGYILRKKKQKNAKGAGLLASPKRQTLKKVVAKGPAGNVQCPHCGTKIDRKQLDRHLLSAHNLK